MTDSDGDGRNAFDYERFSGDNFDIFDVLNWLYKKQGNQGVRDFLVNKLYEMPDQDVDFVLGQLCHLFTQWDTPKGEGLGRFLMYKCSMSITLALKIIFNLQANAAYGTPAQTDRCEELLRECEMSLVNAKVQIGSTEVEREAWLESKKNQQRARQSKADQLVQALLESGEDEAEKEDDNQENAESAITADGNQPNDSAAPQQAGAGGRAVMLRRGRAERRRRWRETRVGRVRH